MSDTLFPTRGQSVCPHDCPSVCSLDIELPAPGRLGRVHGHAGNPYTAGVVCAKVARYAERVHHPQRLLTPLIRTGAKGSGSFAPISWDEALDRIAQAFMNAVQAQGSEAVWPYYYGGTMGLVQRNGINRLRHALRYSGQAGTICVGVANAGWMAGIGAKRGPDSLEVLESDVIIMWGGNPVATQVNLMTHISRARKTRGAKLVVIDVYRTPTVEIADLALILRPGTDGALACAVMHCAFRDGWADRAFLAELTDFPAGLEAHLEQRSPAWAAAITGLSVAEIEAFAALYGRTERAFIRIGYGFSRSRNGAAQFHAVSCLPAVGGKWKHRGGGALWTQSGLFGLDTGLIDGAELRDPAVRVLDMSRIGPILTGDREALLGGPPVTAMLMQNTNPALVAPDSNLVRQGLAREDLFLAVHEQMPTETTRFADVILPATMFVEHADLHKGDAHTRLQVTRPLLEPPGACRSNHEVICALAARLGAEHPAFQMNAIELIDATLARSNLPDGATIYAANGWDFAQDFATQHFLNGFGHKDGRFRFAPDWAALGPDHARLPRLPDHAGMLLEAADAEHPFRLVTAPARHFLNSTFNNTPTSVKLERAPSARIHPDDLAVLGVSDGAWVELGNRRGQVRLTARAFAGLQRGVVVVESLWTAEAFADGSGINCLIGADPVAPAGGVAFHDTAIWIRAARPQTH